MLPLQAKVDIKATCSPQPLSILVLCGGFMPQPSTSHFTSDIWEIPVYDRLLLLDAKLYQDFPGFSCPPLLLGIKRKAEG